MSEFQPPDVPTTEELDEFEDMDDDTNCPRCNGDGRDPWTDYLMPCPLCQGEQRL